MSKSGVGLPNLLKPTALDRPVNQRLETSILYPVSASQASCKFVFDRKGILDSNSQVELAMLLPKIVPNAGGAAAESLSCLPTGTGIAAMIKRAYLEIGGRRVATLDEVGQYVNWRRMRWSPEYREQIADQKQCGSDVFVGLASAAYPIVAPFGVIGRRSNETVQSTAANASVSNERQTLWSEVGDMPTFALSLSQLIPMLRGVQLPLFAIAQEVSLTLEFQPLIEGIAFCAPNGFNTNAGDVVATVHIPTLKIMADYLFYPGEMDNLSEAIMSRGGYDIMYDEVQTQSSFESPGAAGSFDFTAQLALGGKKVKSIITKRLVESSSFNQNAGIYYAKALYTGSSYNWVIDSKPFYAQSVSNSATLFNETSRVDDAPLRLPQAGYSYKNGGGAAYAAGNSNFTNRTFNGWSQRSNQGLTKPVGLRLTNAMGQGKRMSNLPVLFRNTGIQTAAEAALGYTHLFFITCQRMINISNGLVNMIE